MATTKRKTKVKANKKKSTKKKVSGVGGYRPGSGRKPKATEQELIEKLKPLEEPAMKALTKAVKLGYNWAIKLFFQYRFGMPKQVVEGELDNIITINRIIKDQTQ